jgi:TPR repeat protein
MHEPQDNSLDLVRAAAERGVHQAQLMYGQMLLDGTLVDRNPHAALLQFERAAHSGNVMAMNMVGRCFDQGWGVAASKRLAEKWFRKAAEQGLDWGMYNLATLLALGEGGVEQDKTSAYFWFRKAEELGHVKSINILGGFYEDGWIVAQNRATAREHYRRAAIAGDFRGQFNYARFLLQEGDLIGALHWLREVPTTATPAFIARMKSFLAALPQPQIRAQIADFLATLDNITPPTVASAPLLPTPAFMFQETVDALPDTTTAIMQSTADSREQLQG